MTNLHVLYVWARACVCMLRIWMLHSTFEESGASSSAGTCHWYQWKIEKPTWTSWKELSKKRQQKVTKTSSKLPKTHCFNNFLGVHLRKNDSQPLGSSLQAFFCRKKRQHWSGPKRKVPQQSPQVFCWTFHTGVVHLHHLLLNKKSTHIFFICIYHKLILTYMSYNFTLIPTKICFISLPLVDIFAFQPPLPAAPRWSWSPLIRTPLPASHPS